MQQPWATALYPVALGMLLYTIIVSSGYFAQKRVWPIVGMFAVLLILSAISLVAFWQSVWRISLST
jgi:Sec-independent protein secretion pathway component TatC